MFQFIILVLSLLSAVPLGRSSFSCNNIGYDCKHGTCDFLGICICDAGYEGFDCGLKKVSNGTLCTVTCQNRGLCYEGNKCYCTENYMGPTCEDPVEIPICKEQSMLIKMYRPTNFTGEMFLSESMKSCKLTKISTNNPPGYDKFELNLKYKHNGPCQLTKSTNEKTGEVTYTTDVVTLHQKGIYGMSDRVTKMECSYPAMKVGTFQDISNKSTIPVAVTFVDDNFNPVTEIEVGKQYYMDFQVQNLTGYYAVMVTFLEAYSVNLNERRFESAVLIENGCVDKLNDEKYQISLGTEPRPDGQWRVKLKGFKLLDNARMEFNYRVKLCRTICREMPCNNLLPLPKGAEAAALRGYMVN